MFLHDSKTLKGLTTFETLCVYNVSVVKGWRHSATGAFPPAFAVRFTRVLMDVFFASKQFWAFRTLECSWQMLCNNVQLKAIKTPGLKFA